MPPIRSISSVIMVCCTVLFGCEQKEEVSPPPTTSAMELAFIGNEDFFRRDMQPILQAVDERLGSIEMNFNVIPASQTALQDLLDRDLVPDLVLTSFPFYQIDTDQIYPLDKENFEDYPLDKGLVSYIRSIDSRSRLIGIPSNTQFYALYFNKTVFDRFELDYPDETMTWTKLYETSERMVKMAEAEGFYYEPLSLSPTAVALPLRERPIPYTNPNTGDVLFTKNPEYVKYLELMKTYLTLPGVREDFEMIGRSRDGNYSLPPAMYIASHMEFQFMNKTQWESMDVAPVPVWEDRPNVGPYLSAISILFIPMKSDDKDKAVHVLKTFLSKDIQAMIAAEPKGLFAPVLVDSDVLRQFGSGIGSYKGKTIEAFFKRTPATPNGFSKWDQYRELDPNFKSFFEYKLDITNYLSYLQRESERKIGQAQQLEGR